MPVPPQRHAIAKAQPDSSWRFRTAMALALMGAGVLGAGATNLDWNGDAAMALGELAGMAAPLALAAGAVLFVLAAGSRRS